MAVPGESWRRWLVLIKSAELRAELEAKRKQFLKEQEEKQKEEA